MRYAPFNDDIAKRRRAFQTQVGFNPNNASKAGINIFHVIVLQTILTQFVYGQFSDFFGSAGEQIRLFVIISIVSISILLCVVCFFKGLVIEGIISIASILAIFYFTYIYSQNTFTPFTLAAGGEYFGYSLISGMALIIQRQELRRYLYIFYAICCVYAVLHVAASLAVQFGVIDAGSGTRAFRTADDAGRNDRIVISSFAIVFGICFSIARIIYDFKIRYLMLFLVFILSLSASSSRLITFISLSVILAYVFYRNTNHMNRIAFSAFLLGTLFSIYLIFFPEINPYVYAEDASGLVRGKALFIAADLMQYYWLFGAGIAYGADGYTAITGSKFFFPNDIGMIGILFMYGVGGLAFYIFVTYHVSKIYKYATTYGMSKPMADALALTAIVFIMYSLQTPHLDGSAPAAMLAMMALALFLNQRRIRPAVDVMDR